MVMVCMNHPKTVGIISAPPSTIPQKEKRKPKGLYCTIYNTKCYQQFLIMESIKDKVEQVTEIFCTCQKTGFAGLF